MIACDFNPSGYTLRVTLIDNITREAVEETTQRSLIDLADRPGTRQVAAEMAGIVSESINRPE
jgi:hypothetical protein